MDGIGYTNFSPRRHAVSKMVFLACMLLAVGPTTAQSFAASRVSEESLRDLSKHSPCSPKDESLLSRPNDSMPHIELAARIRTTADVMGLAWSPDSRWFVTSEDLGKVAEIWDAQSGHQRKKFVKQAAGTKAILFTPDGNGIIVPSMRPFDGKSRTAISIIDIETGSVVRNVDGPNDPSDFVLANQPQDFLLSRDGERLFMTFNTNDRRVHIYNTSTWAEVGSINSAPLLMQSGPKVDGLTTVEGDGVVHVWDVSANLIMNEFPMPMPFPESIAIAPNACLLAIGAGPTMKTFNPSVGKLIPVADPTPIRVWNLKTGGQVGEGSAIQLIRGLTFNSDETLLAATSSDKSILIFKTDDLSNFRVLTRVSVNLVAIAFSPNGQYLAAAGDDRVFIFRVE